MEVTNLQNANNDILTPFIRNEFEKIYFEFSNTEQKPIYLHSVLNLILTYKSSNVLLNDENETFINEDFIKYQEIFNTGFKEGYLIAKEHTEDTIDIKIKIDRIFGGIYKKLNELKETHTFLIKSNEDKYTFELMEYYNYGIKVGKFVLCWDYIINNSSLFEDIFNLNYTAHKTVTKINSAKENTLNWQGSTLEFSEFSKALIESGFIGKIKNEKEVFEKMKQFFNVDDFDKSDKLKQVRSRTKTLTPVINTLEVALTNWIIRKD